MVFKTKHFGIIAAAIMLGVGLWVLPGFAQMRHGGGGRAGGPNLFFLMRAAQLTIDADTTINAKVTTKTGPNPMHWHFDRITLDDSALGVPVDALATQWTYSLNGADMSHEWTVI